MGNGKQDLILTNKLICGDNLEVLATMEKESVDLIYIDPPFFSNRNYEIIWGDEAEIRSFEDRWEGDTNVYIDWMKQRITELHKILKPTGSFYLHCDWHAGHYLKVMCDEIFGYNNFQNEIVWSYQGTGEPKKFFKRKHDNIFFYSKTNDYYFNSNEAVEKISDFSKSKYTQKDKDGLYKEIKHSDGKIYKQYKKDFMRMRDVWEIPVINAMAKERLGYPTQKPEALLERIIKASSNKNDVVCDAFCGCGTALAVAQKLGRRWIGIDISPSAIALIKNRMNIIGTIESINYEVVGMPQKIDDLKNFKPYEFQYWVINELHGVPSPRKSGDMGIDGLSFLEHHPIQVKQSEGVGRNVIDNFETAMRRKKATKGYIVALSFGKGAYEEVARVKKEGIEIKLITAQDIIDKKHSASKEMLF
jgi:DNA modification methylase